jgi:hypothetical protein
MVGAPGTFGMRHLQDLLYVKVVARRPLRAKQDRDSLAPVMWKKVRLQLGMVSAR